MPSRHEIEAVARLMCRQNNDSPDLVDHSKPRWMLYRRKAERLLVEAESVRGKKPARKCGHPPQLRELYLGDAVWTCTMCGEEFETNDSRQPLTDDRIKELKREAAMEAHSTAADLPVSR
jgi:hypothetical protein